MPDRNQENPIITIARELNKKYEFYFIALVFATLALSVQTASLIKEFYQYVFEILAWFSLLVSGLVGLWRLEWLPHIFYSEGKIQNRKYLLDVMNQGLEGSTVINGKGQKWSKEDLNNTKIKLEQIIDKGEMRVKKIEKRMMLKYRIHKWAFLVGIVSLVISRAILHIVKLFPSPVN